VYVALFPFIPDIDDAVSVMHILSSVNLISFSSSFFFDFISQVATVGKISGGNEEWETTPCSIKREWKHHTHCDISVKS